RFTCRLRLLTGFRFPNPSSETVVLMPEPTAFISSKHRPVLGKYRSMLSTLRQILVPGYASTRSQSTRSHLVQSMPLQIKVFIVEKAVRQRDLGPGNHTTLACRQPTSATLRFIRRPEISFLRRLGGAHSWLCPRNRPPSEHR